MSLCKNSNYVIAPMTLIFVTLHRGEMEINVTVKGLFKKLGVQILTL